MKEKCCFAKEMGKRVAQRRKELGLTQEKAAERCGLSHQFFASIETGGKNVRGESLLKLSMGLDISADYLLTGRVIDLDLDQVLQQLKQLSGEEYHHVRTVIQEYMWALGYR